MSNSTLYGQLMSYLRQHSRYCDATSQSAGMDGECFDLQWAVEFGSMGTLRADSCSKPKAPSGGGEIHEQRPDSSRSPVSAVSDGGFERVATKRVYLALTRRSSGIATV